MVRPSGDSVAAAPWPGDNVRASDPTGPPSTNRRGETTMPTWEDTSHGIAWRIDLDRDRLLPGRLVAGRVTVTADDDTEARRLVVTLIGVESWQHEETST